MSLDLKQVESRRRRDGLYQEQFVQSHTVKVAARDQRCRYWAKVVRSDQPILQPFLVAGANDVPGAYLQRGEEELLPGDALLEGEANHHRRNDRGWTYFLTYAAHDGTLLSLRSSFSTEKAAMKAQGLAPELLKGSGDVAAMIRIIHGLRLGMKFSVTET